MLLALHAFFFSPQISAQTLPSSADPARFDNYLGQEKTNQISQEIKEKEQINLEDQIPFPEKDGFLLKNITFKGNSVFSDTDLRNYTKDYLDHSVDFKTLNHLTKNIAKLYRENGYFITKAIVPEQTIEESTLTIQIIEGHIINLFIDDPDNLLSTEQESLTKKLTKKIKSMNVLHGPTLEKYILLFNENTSIKAQSIMSPSKDTEKLGGIDITLKISKEKPRYSISYNNHGSSYVGPGQISASYQHGGLLSAYDQISLNTTLSTTVKEVQYINLNYSSLLNDDGVRLQTSASYSNSEPGENLKALEAESDTFSWDVKTIFPVVKSRRSNLNLSTGFAFKNSATEFLGEELIDDKTRKFTFGLDYDTQHNKNAFTSASLALHKGVNIFDGSKKNDSNLSRSQGDPKFAKLAGNITHYHKLSSQFSLLSNVEGQYASSPLLSSEEFGFGGATMGRAYDPSEITGDNGIAFSTELQYNDTPNIVKNLSLKPFAFYDIGKVWNKDTSTQPESAASFGIGTYYQWDDLFNGSMSLAYPLTKKVDNPVMNGETGPRFLFSIQSSF